MSKLTTYSSLYIDNEKESIPFFAKYLNFILVKTIKISVDENWWVLIKEGKERRGIILIKTNPINHHKSTLILNAHDSVLEYCKMKESGIEGISEPTYTTLGLSFNFYDPSGNKIMILEERIYNDLEI